jgi:hypothetical protein
LEGWQDEESGNDVLSCSCSVHKCSKFCLKYIFSAHSVLL